MLNLCGGSRWFDNPSAAICETQGVFYAVCHHGFERIEQYYSQLCRFQRTLNKTWMSFLILRNECMGFSVFQDKLIDLELLTSILCSLIYLFA